jgi:hypothetical protein
MRLARGIEQNVVRFDIAMQNPALMGMMDGPDDFHHELGGLARGHRAAAQFLPESRPVNEAHGKEMPADILAYFVDGRDMGMIEPRRRFRFGMKALDHTRGSQFAGGDNLKRDLAVGAALTGAEDDAHATARYFAEQFVAAKFAALEQVRWRSGILLFSEGGQRHVEQTTCTKAVGRAIAQRGPALGAALNRASGFFAGFHSYLFPDLLAC